MSVKIGFAVTFVVNCSAAGYRPLDTAACSSF